MKRQNTILRITRKELQQGRYSDGFVILMIIPVFLVLLAFTTALVGCISCSLHAMAHTNEMLQAYSILEEDQAVWQKEVLADKLNDAYEKDYEKVISTQTLGPYILLVKEMRNKATGKVLVNRLEFIPIEKADGQTS
ncbi:MAG: hypothetical protein IJ858_04535 [Acidaminococcaceae bacterium]|nr:hypothetical protein [Acidaminococcaceae bacterium]HBX75893.1 hypothetical protein [Acidaminococcaceae bacterium]